MSTPYDNTDGGASLDAYARRMYGHILDAAQEPEPETPSPAPTHTVQFLTMAEFKQEGK